MNPDVIQCWENFLNPDVQRSRLISSAIFIATFQSLKDSIIDRARGIFWCGFRDNQEIFDPKYQSEVLSRNQSPLYASLDWLWEMNAIDANDIEAFNRVKGCRNHLAHELLNVVCGKGLPDDYSDRFKELAGLLRKIEVWWIRNMEDIGEDVDESAIVPGRIINLDLLCGIAIEGDRSFYEYMRKQSIVASA